MRNYCSIRICRACVIQLNLRQVHLNLRLDADARPLCGVQRSRWNSVLGISTPALDPIGRIGRKTRPKSAVQFSISTEGDVLKAGPLKALLEAGEKDETIKKLLSSNVFLWHPKPIAQILFSYGSPKQQTTGNLTPHVGKDRPEFGMSQLGQKAKYSALAPTTDEVDGSRSRHLGAKV